MSEQEHVEDEQEQGAAEYKQRDPSYDIFRRNAVMFNFYKPSWVEYEGKTRPRFFVSASTYNPQMQKMDFKNRITVTLNPTDLGKLLHGMKNGEKVDLFHKSQFKTTTISYDPTKCTFGMSEKKETGDPKRAFVNLLPEEGQVLMVLFQNAILTQTWGQS